MQETDISNIITQSVTIPEWNKRKLRADILRLDQIHPLVSGNKWFKLRYYLEEARQQQKKKLVTFGGAWSNHILATAAACEMQSIPCAGIIRGEAPAQPSPILQAAAAMGMELYYTDRVSFAREAIPPALNHPDHYVVAAGGRGAAGVRGAGTMLDHCNNLSPYTHICCAVGTGTMMAGLINRCLPGQTVIGISVMKNNHSLESEIQAFLLKEHPVYHLLHSYHFGGYAKQNEELFGFMNNWYRQTGIPTDFVYTGKLCYAVSDLCQQGFFPEKSHLLIIHSGGLSGNASLEKGTLIF